MATLWPAAFRRSTKKPVCVACQEEMEVYSLKKDLADQPYRVEETAYYCRKESQYFYHYVGGRKKLDVWLGPVIAGDDAPYATVRACGTCISDS